MLDFVEENEAWLTYASSAGPKQKWRCAVSARHFSTPDIRERCASEGYGKTARMAIAAAMEL